MKVAVLQTAPLHDAPGPNRVRVLEMLEQAGRAGARLAVLPECAVSGYAIATRERGLQLAEPIPGPTTRMIRAHCARTGSVVVIGLLERVGDTVHNSAVVIGPRDVVGGHRKTNVPCFAADRFVTRRAMASSCSRSWGSRLV